MDAHYLKRGATSLLPLAIACGGHEAIAPLPSGSESGSVEVIVTTVGSQVDPNGYDLRVGVDNEFRIGVNDSVLVADLPIRDLHVTLLAVSTNCEVAPSASQVASIESGGIARIAFLVTCRAPTVLTVVVKTGGYLRPLTYSIAIDDAQTPQPPRFADSLTIQGLAPGNRTVTLNSLPNNCSVIGKNPKQVEVRYDLPAALEFVVSCGGQLRDQILFGGRLPGDFVRVYAVNASDGDGLVLVASATAAAASPDGRTLALYRTGVHAIMLLDLPSGTLRDIDTPAPASEPAWSPDGQRIVFVMSEDIYVVNADGSGLVQLTSHPALDVSPAWSPDGSKIVFQSHRDGPPPDNGEIYVMDADGSNLKNLTNQIEWDGDPDWSPDGQQIVFASDRDSTVFRTVFIMNADGSNPVRFTSSTSATTGSDSEPSWSPDGRRIVYVSTLAGLRTIAPDGSFDTELIPFGVFEIGPSHPEWTRP